VEPSALILGVQNWCLPCSETIGDTTQRFVLNPHIQEARDNSPVMVSVELIETLAQSLCGLSAILFTFIASFSRSMKAERMIQSIILFLLLACAATLWWLSLAGGTLWGSNYLPKPLSLFCIILALSARMNIKGTNVSFGANPHSIRRGREEE